MGKHAYLLLCSKLDGKTDKLSDQTKMLNLPGMQHAMSTNMKHPLGENTVSALDTLKNIYIYLILNAMSFFSLQCM